MAAQARIVMDVNRVELAQASSGGYRLVSAETVATSTEAQRPGPAAAFLWLAAVSADCSG